MVSTNDEIVNEVTSVEVQQPTTEIKTITEEEFEKAQKTFQLGKKNLLLNKYDESVNNIEEACKIYSAKYGELDPQCAEIYYFYGRALLELARVENTVLGNALSGVPEESGPINDSRYGNPDEVAAEEKDDIAEKVMDAMCTNEEEREQKSEEKKPEEENKPTEEEKKPEEEKVESKSTGEEVMDEEAKKKEENGAEDDGEGDEEEEEEEDISKNEDAAGKEGDEEDISNLQRSWEMFELAKLIYQKNFNDDQQLKNKRIAECLLKLGEISIEQEIYDQATTDIRECIRMQEEQSERDERMLAESYYQLGLAQQFNNLFSEATESYQRSINILQIRVEKLKGKLLTIALEGDDAQLERNTINDEIAELETLLPELNGKLEEVNEQGQQSLNLIKEAKECFINSMNGNSNELNSKPINGNGECKDITSLMKSKRKISSSDDVSNLKKTRLSANGNELINNEAAPVEESAEAKIDIDDKENGTAVAPVAAETTEEKKPEENGNVEMGEKEESKPVESNQAEPAKVEENCA